MNIDYKNQNYLEMKSTFKSTEEKLFFAENDDRFDTREEEKVPSVRSSARESVDLQPGESKAKGILCVVSGMLSQGVLGIVPIWGNVNIYITSYLRAADSTVTMESTYIVFPITITMSAFCMLLGSYLIEKINPRIQMALGGLCVSLPLLICSFTTNYLLFVFLYSVIIGLGFGLLYMLAVRNAWQFFPSKKGMISGIIMSCYSIGAIFWIFISKAIANPDNIKPTDVYVVGDKTEYFYSADSEVVKNVPIMLRTLAIIYAVMIVGAVICVNKRVFLPYVR